MPGPALSGACIRRQRMAKSAKRSKAATWRSVVTAGTTFLSEGRNVVVNLFLIAAILVLVPLILRESFKENVIIEPITIPKMLSDRGYSADVGAYRLWDALSQISAESGTAKERPQLQAAAQQFDFAILDQGGSLRSMLIGLKKFFRLYDTRIAGEFVCAGRACARENLALRVRVFRADVSFVQFEEMGSSSEDDYFLKVAVEIMRRIDPYIAAAYLFNKDREQSVAIANEMIRVKHPHLKWALNLIGSDYSDNRQPDKAIEWYSKALEIDRTFAIARYNIASVQFDQGKLEAAEGSARLAIQYNPTYARAHGLLAEIVGAKNFTEGERLYAKAVELERDNASIYNDRGRFYRRNKNNDKARSDFQTAIRINPKLPFPHYNLANIYAEEENVERAESHYKKAIREAPSRIAYYSAFGNFYLKLKRYSDAMPLYLKAAELDHKQSQFLYRLAVDAEKNDQRPVAIDAYRAFLKMNKDGENVEAAKAGLQHLVAAANRNNNNNSRRKRAER